MRAGGSGAHPCPECSHPCSARARFCPACGYQRLERAGADARRAVGAILVLFGGVLLTLAVLIVLHPAGAPPFGSIAELRLALLQATSFVGCGLLAVGVMGRVAWRESLGGPCSRRELALGLGVGLAGFAVTFSYSQLLMGLGLPPSETDAPPATPTAWAIVACVYVLLPALGEEWTDRGVLWAAVRRIAGPGTTLFATAMLFAFMHGLNGGWLLEVPHRFLAGLGLGWLRLRTGSLWPGIFGHALLNSLAVLV